MSDFLLILIVLAIFAGSYQVMGRIDRFLDSSFHCELPECQQHPPSSIMLSDSLSDEELIDAIRHFAAQHEQTIIILRDSMPDDAGGNNA